MLRAACRMDMDHVDMDAYLATVQGHYGCGFAVRRFPAGPMTVVTCRLPLPVSDEHAEQMDDLVSSVVDVAAAAAQQQLQLLQQQGGCIVVEVMRAVKPTPRGTAVTPPPAAECAGESVACIMHDSCGGRVRVRRCPWADLSKMKACGWVMSDARTNCCISV